MLAPLARRIVLARPVASAIQTRQFGPSTPSNSDASPAKELADLKRPMEIMGDTLEPAAKAELVKIREIEDELMATASQEAEPIDWNAWKKTMRHPTIVDELKQMFEATPPPDVEAERARMEKAVDDTFNPMIAELEHLVKEHEKDAIEYEKQAKDVMYLSENIDTIPIDEFLSYYPETRKAIEKDIQAGKWFQDEEEQVESK